MIHIFSHRGNCREALENSWQAFNLSKETGIWGIEFDVHLTKDHELVVMHDRSLRRTVGKNGTVSHLTRKQLSSITLKNGDSIPFLDEVIANLVPDMELNIELKTYSKVTAEVVARHLQGTKYPKRLLISSKSSKVLSHLSRIMPESRLAYVLETPKIFSADFLLNNLEKLIQDIPTLEAIHPDIALLTDQFVEAFRRYNWLINPWFPLASENTLPDPKWFDLLSFGIDGVITNEPRAFLSWVQEKQDLKKSS